MYACTHLQAYARTYIYWQYFQHFSPYFRCIGIGVSRRLGFRGLGWRVYNCLRRFAIPINKHSCLVVSTGSSLNPEPQNPPTPAPAEASEIAGDGPKLKGSDWSG